MNEYLSYFLAFPDDDVEAAPWSRLLFEVSASSSGASLMTSGATSSLSAWKSSTSATSSFRKSNLGSEWIQVFL